MQRSLAFATLTILALGCGGPAGLGDETETETDADADAETDADAASGTRGPENSSSDASGSANAGDDGDGSSSGEPSPCDDCDAKAWSAPLGISEPSNFIRQPRIDVADGGDAVAVWYRGERVVSNRYDHDDSAWLDAEELVHEAPPNIALWDLGPQLDVAMDVAGNAVAVWNGVLVDAKRGDIYAARFDAATGSWLGAQVVEHDDAGSALEPRIAMHALGDAVVVWQQYGPVRRSIRRNRYDAASGTWTGDEPVEPADPALPWDSGSPRVAMNSHGDAVVAWPGPNAGEGGINTPAVRQYFANSNLWTPIEYPQPLGGSNTRVAVDAAGDVTVVWTRTTSFATHVLATRFDADAGTWSSAEELRSTVGIVDLCTDLAVDDAGNVVALWRDQDHDTKGTPFDVRTARFGARSGTWSPARQLEVAEGSVLEAAVHVAGNGDGVALWITSTPDAYALKTSRLIVEAGDWGSTTGLVEDEERTLTELDVRTDGDGGAIAIWLQRPEGEEPVVTVSHYD